MRIDLWSRLRTKKPWSGISKHDFDNQPLIHQVPRATDYHDTSPQLPSRASVQDSGRKTIRSGSYILLDEKGRDDVASIATQEQDRHHHREVLPWLSRHKLFLGCLLPLFSVLFEVTMLSLFLYMYLSLPMDPQTGTRRRISPQYSMWPFVSCVGSAKLEVFQGLSFAIVFCSITALFLLFYLNYRVEPGYWLRRLQLLQTLAANGLLIWLVFASEDNATHLHLYVVSLRLLLLFGAKCTSWLTAYAMRMAYPLLKDDRAAITSFRLKMILMPFAFVLAVLANAGVFTCRHVDQIQEKGTTCYALIAAAAISDWLYSTVNVAFLMVMAYDLYYDEHFGMVGKGLPTPRPSWE